MFIGFLLFFIFLFLIVFGISIYQLYNYSDIDDFYIETGIKLFIIIVLITILSVTC
jgi:hypothetical protein